jgi:hypothetical protein
MAYADGAPYRLPGSIMAYPVFSAAGLPATLQTQQQTDRPPSASLPICAVKSHLPIDSDPSDMLRASDHISSDLAPINTRVQLLIHQPADHHVVSPHQVQAMRLFGRRLVVALLADDAFDRVG